MHIISPSFKILSIPKTDDILRIIEFAGRICYKTESKIGKDTNSFIKRLIQSGHHSVIEHISVSVLLICDRGVSHELVRHRLASFSQESTRFANYSKEQFGKEITVIKPFFWKEDSNQYSIWLEAMQNAEKSYLSLIELGAKAEEARSVLPNSLKTEIVISCNIREWRHIFQLRCAKDAHPQMREIMLPILKEFRNIIPILFEDIHIEML